MSLLCLPPELLASVLNDGDLRQTDLLSVLKTCRVMYNNTLPVLYREPVGRFAPQSAILHHLLHERSDLAALVRKYEARLGFLPKDIYDASEIIEDAVIPHLANCVELTVMPIRYMTIRTLRPNGEAEDRITRRSMALAQIIDTIYTWPIKSLDIVGLLEIGYSPLRSLPKTLHRLTIQGASLLYTQWQRVWGPCEGSVKHLRIVEALNFGPNALDHINILAPTLERVELVWGRHMSPLLCSRLPALLPKVAILECDPYITDPFTGPHYCLKKLTVNAGIQHAFASGDNIPQYFAHLMQSIEKDWFPRLQDLIIDTASELGEWPVDVQDLAQTAGLCHLCERKKIRLAVLPLP